MIDPASGRRGPRTPEGKARSALNALRHGLRARRFCLLPHEDPAEFEALARAARAAYRPSDPIERELVEAIAVALWREIRADRAEAEALADIPPADGSRSCGTDLGDREHRARLETLMRYRAQAALGVRRAQQALERHRALRAAGERLAGAVAGAAVPAFERAAEPASDAPGAGNDGEQEKKRTNEFTEARSIQAADEPRRGEDPATGAGDATEAATPVEAVVADELAAPGSPTRVNLRDAVRAAANPLDTPLSRALGRDPDLVLPVPGLKPQLWPLCQHLADPEKGAREGLRPYRRVPHLPPDQWYGAQHLLEEMEKTRRRAA